MQFKFVYVGRLDKEKGLEDIVFAFRRLLIEKQFNLGLDIFGQEGNCSKIVQELQQEYPQHVCYHGRQDKSTIHQYWQSCHYVLMPSHFLETFGLACLDAYYFGKPVIGYKKGGLQELILEKYAIVFRQHGQTKVDGLYNKIVEVLQNFDNGIYQQDCHKCREVFDNYSVIVWKESFLELYKSLDYSISLNNLGSHHILLVSDYLHRFGGIEVFLHESKQVLESMGFEIQLLGSSFASRFFRLIGLVYSACNITSGLSLGWRLWRKNYDVIWFHSVQRYLGRFPLWITSFFSSKRIFMLHDVGLLHPYPSLVTQVSQLQFKRGLSAYIEAGRYVGKKGFLNLLSMAMKFISAQIIRFCLRSFDLILVPSSFLVDPVSQRFGTSQKKTITVLPHFVSIIK